MGTEPRPVMITAADGPFRCPCGCNVFRREKPRCVHCGKAEWVHRDHPKLCGDYNPMDGTKRFKCNFCCTIYEAEA